MTTSLGPRWALTGPFMTNIFGGGGGREGYKRVVTHFRPVVAVLQKDMDENRKDLSDENVAIVDASVQKYLDNVDLAALEKERDEVLVELAKLKAEKKYLK